MEISAKLQRLELLARDSSIESRSRLLSTLSEQVFAHRIPNAEEVALLCDVARLLLTLADEPSRESFAIAVAPSYYTPRDMVFRLVDDTIRIARPVLERSPVLKDADLIELARTRADAYLAAIAHRSHLEHRIVEALLKRGGPEVQLAVSENRSAVLSSDAIKILLQTSEQDEAVCRSLVTRPEIGKADGERLVQQIARILKSRMSTPSKLEVIPTPSLLVKAKTRLGLKELLAEINAGNKLKDDAIIELADADRFNELTTLIGQLAHIEEVTIMRLIVRADANGISMVMKALDVGDLAFRSIVALRQRRLKHSDTQARFDRDDYKKINPREARTMASQLSGGRGRF